MWAIKKQKYIYAFRLACLWFCELTALIIMIIMIMTMMIIKQINCRNFFKEKRKKREILIKITSYKHRLTATAWVWGSNGHCSHIFIHIFSIFSPLFDFRLIFAPHLMFCACLVLSTLYWTLVAIKKKQIYIENFEKVNLDINNMLFIINANQVQ